MADVTGGTSARAPLSAAALMVLREPDVVNDKDVLKTAMKELLAARVWRIEIVDRPSGTMQESVKSVWSVIQAAVNLDLPRPRWRRRLLLVVEGDRQPPHAAPLPVVSEAVTRLPARDHGGVLGRELSAVARHMANHPNAVSNVVVQPLEAAGLIYVKKKWHRLSDKTGRTPAGDTRLAASRRRDKQERGAASLDTEVDIGRWFDPKLDVAFDGEYEAVFDWSWNRGWNTSQFWDHFGP